MRPEAHHSKEHSMALLPDLTEYQALVDHQKRMADTHQRDLFAQDPERGRTFALEAVGIYLDYSKNLLTRQTLDLLEALANACGLDQRIAAMFRGDKINVT